MPKYRFFDFLLDSNFKIPELPKVKEGICSLSCKLLNSPLSGDDGFVFSQFWETPEGQVTIEFGKKKTISAFAFLK